LGWVPHPKAAKTRLNEILPAFYEARAFEILEKLDKHESRLSFIRGNKPAARGHFLKKEFNIKVHDNRLFRQDGIRLKAGQESKHAFNIQAKARMTSLISCAESDRARLDCRNSRSSTVLRTSRVKRMKKQGRGEEEGSAEGETGEDIDRAHFSGSV